MVAPGTVSQRIDHLLAHVLDEAGGTTSPDAETTWLEILTTWFGPDVLELNSISSSQFAGWIQETLAEIDELLEAQLQELLHASPLQKLESSWRGLAYLIENVAQYRQIEVHALDVSWKELARDAQSTIVFDHTRIFKHIYESEFGSPGGCPFGLLVGDFEISHLPQQSVDTLSLVRQLTGTAAAAFAPLILGVTPQMFGADDIPSLERGINLRQTFSQKEYLDWQSWCASPDARFLGLAMPRFLIRPPYSRATTPGSEFLFTEHCSKPADYLWCNAAFALAAVVARSYGETGWFDDFLGPVQDDERRGVLSNLPWLTHHSDPDWPLPPIEWVVPDPTAQELAESGFTCLRHCKYTPDVMVQSAPNISAMTQHRSSIAMQTELLDIQLYHILAVSRFAHYIKRIARDLIGSALSEDDVQASIHTWLGAYTCADPNPTPAERRKQPLKDAFVQVHKSESHPGTYLCRVEIQPHDLHQRLAVKFQLKSASHQPLSLGS